MGVFPLLHTFGCPPAGTEAAGSCLTGCMLLPQCLSVFSTPAIGHCPVIITRQPDGSRALSLHGDTDGAPGCATHHDDSAKHQRAKVSHWAPNTYSRPCLLPVHPCLPAAVSGELALTAPALGTSQGLVGQDHHAAYFAGMPPLPSPSSAAAADADTDAGAVPSSSSSGTSSGTLSGGWFLRRTGDAVERLPGGGYRALGRIDDCLNLEGVKVSAGGRMAGWVGRWARGSPPCDSVSIYGGADWHALTDGCLFWVGWPSMVCLRSLPGADEVQLERVCCEGVAGVAEAAAVGCPPPGGGPEELVLFIVPLFGEASPASAAGTARQLADQLQQHCQEVITSRLNPLFQVGVQLPRRCASADVQTCVLQTHAAADVAP